MPSSRHARITRIAISPRLATKTLLKSLLFIPSNVRACASSHREQRLRGTDDITLLDIHLAHRAGDRGDDVVLHLHRLEHRYDIAELDGVAGLDRDLHDEPLHRRDHGAFA